MTLMTPPRTSARPGRLRRSHVRQTCHRDGISPGRSRDGTDRIAHVARGRNARVTPTRAAIARENDIRVWLALLGPTPYRCIDRLPTGHSVKLDQQARFSTICIHAGQEPDPATGAIITPIYQTSTYVQDGLGQPHQGFEYGRTQNPTRMALERNLAAIESGTAAFAFASGMAAIDAILTRLQSGDHVVVSDNTYGGTFRLFERVRRKFGLDFTYVDTSRLELVEPALTPKTKYLFIESPTNPMLHITDIGCVSQIAHRHDVRVVVDNTFASPVSSSARSSSAPTSCSTARRSSSTATATASAASSSSSTPTMSSG